MGKKESAEKAVRDIRRKTRRRFSAEEKIRIVIEGLRGEESIASLCRREDIEAVRVPGSGRGLLPDFSDTMAFPEKEVNLFLPGIASLEFLRDENGGLVYLDPNNGNNPVDQSHFGSIGIATGLGCRDCHTAASGDAYDPPQPGGFFSGDMESLVPRRGGVDTPTPIPPPPAP